MIIGFHRFSTVLHQKRSVVFIPFFSPLIDYPVIKKHRERGAQKHVVKRIMKIAFQESKPEFRSVKVTGMSSLSYSTHDKRTPKQTNKQTNKYRYCQLAQIPDFRTPK